MRNNGILWLPSWFPSQRFPQNGDFILRHAEAVSYNLKVSILYVTSSENIDKKESFNLSECLSIKQVFFRRRRFFNFLLYFYNYWNAFRAMYKKGTFPEIVHVHVCYKAGLFALWLKWRFGIPYGITEHWTFFTKERKDNYLKSNFLKKWLIKIIYNNSSFVLPVSFNLEGQLLNFFPKISSFVIPNVVDPISFFYSTNSQKSDSFHFIHVSSLGLLKNPMIILKVFIRLLIKYRNVGLDIVGPINDDFLNEFEKLDHGRDKINLVGQIEHHEVADKLRIANAFVLFSSSENLPCVIAESLCCGVPVISSSVGGIPEMVNDSNGILVTPGDEEALYSAMEDMILDYSKYDRKKISEEAQSKYNPEVVGKQIADVYEKVLSKKPGK